MKNPESARASWAARALVRGSNPTPALGRATGTQVVEGVESENWLGYESIHPMTWVPGRAVADAAGRVERTRAAARG